MILPLNSSSTFIEDNSNNLGIRIATLSPETIRNLLNTKSHQQIKSNFGIYFIPCINGKMIYISETARNL